MAKNLKQLRITEFVCKVMKNKWLKILLIVVAAALLLSMPLGGTWWTRILINAGLMCMCVLGLNVIIGYTGMFNLGYIAMFGIGAYTYAILASPHLNIHLPFLLIFPLAGLFAGIAGALLTIPVARLRGDYLALVTLAFGEVFRLVANNLPLTNGALGIINIDTPKILSWTINSPQKHYYLVLFLVVIEAFLMSRLRRSRIGRALAAIREDEDAARAMGINSFQLKVLANFVGAIPAGLAGVLFAANQTFVSPESFVGGESIVLLSMLVIGGTGSVAGALIGAVFLSVLPEPLRKTIGDLRMLVYALLLIVFAILKPMGIIPPSTRMARMEEVYGSELPSRARVITGEVD